MNQVKWLEDGGSGISSQLLSCCGQGCGGDAARLPAHLLLPSDRAPVPAWLSVERFPGAGGYRKPARNGLGLAGSRGASGARADACQIQRGFFLGSARRAARRRSGRAVS